eukprot:2794356-Pleurochrysis_carterae.AAC.2
MSGKRHAQEATRRSTTGGTRRWAGGLASEHDCTPGCTRLGCELTLWRSESVAVSRLREKNAKRQGVLPGRVKV